MMAGEFRFTRLGTTLADLDAAWNDRLLDAQAMRVSGRTAASIMFGVYSLEIYLKARICRKLALTQLPKAFEIHDLDGLLMLSGLFQKTQAKSARGMKANWTFIVRTSERLNEMRYSPDDRWTSSDAATFFEQLTGEPDGVLTWLRRQR
jgi:hypothetical protein